MANKHIDKLDKILRQLAISDRRMITIKVATPLEYSGGLDAVRVELSDEDIAARKALLEALKVTDDDLLIEVQRFCTADHYQQVLASGLPKVLSISART